MQDSPWFIDSHSTACSFSWLPLTQRVHLLGFSSIYVLFIVFLCQRDIRYAAKFFFIPHKSIFALKVSSAHFNNENVQLYLTFQVREPWCLESWWGKLLVEIQALQELPEERGKGCRNSSWLQCCVTGCVPYYMCRSCRRSWFDPNMTLLCSSALEELHKWIRGVNIPIATQSQKTSGLCCVASTRAPAGSAGAALGVWAESRRQFNWWLYQKATSKLLHPAPQPPYAASARHGSLLVLLAWMGSLEILPSFLLKRWSSRSLGPTSPFSPRLLMVLRPSVMSKCSFSTFIALVVGLLKKVPFADNFFRSWLGAFYLPNWISSYSIFTITIFIFSWKM